VLSRVQGVALRGLVAAVPARVESVADLAASFGDDAARRIADATGIEARHVVAEGQGLLDLARPAASRLLERLGWASDEVGALVVVTQTGERVLPAAACVLQHALGLPKGTAAFDLNLGCSGYVYGLYALASLFATSDVQRAILIAGDVTSTLCGAADRNVRPLFGDAVVATALERDEAAGAMCFALGSDGAGAPYLTAPRDGTLFMDGTQVFALTLREVPGNVGDALRLAGWRVEDVAQFVLHQANAMMLKRLGAKLGIPAERLVIALERFGNTSSASIPLAMVSALAQQLAARPTNLLLSGFGVGWSWGSAALTCGPLDAIELLEVA
jgi:3-oxoacyl-[acyl-carrier-protein] synthase III